MITLLPTALRTTVHLLRTFKSLLLSGVFLLNIRLLGWRAGVNLFTYLLHLCLQFNMPGTERSPPLACYSLTLSNTQAPVFQHPKHPTGLTSKLSLLQDYGHVVSFSLSLLRLLILRARERTWVYRWGGTEGERVLSLKHTAQPKA